MWYKIVDPSILLSADSTLLIKAKGCVWHKSSIANGVIPHSGIDTEMQCGGDSVIQRVGWIFEYKLHLISSTIGSSVIVPLPADFLQQLPT